jgi:2-(3-amino-3-carboxypropyl)histidine synthase
MDVHFIEVRYNIEKVKGMNKLISILPRRVGLATTVQYLDIAKEISNFLRKEGFEVIVGKSKKLPHEMQILGCDVSAAKLDVDAILFVGEGEFHPREIARKTGKRVIRFNPITGEVDEVDSDYKRILALLGKFETSTKVGIIISIKPGQYKLSEAKLLKKFLEQEEKEVFLFVGDCITPQEAQNYPEIDFWVIAACPRVFEDFVKNNIPALPLEVLTDYCSHHRLRKVPESDTSKSGN